jgi:hypothetical protein
MRDPSKDLSGGTCPPAETDRFRPEKVRAGRPKPSPGRPDRYGYKVYVFSPESQGLFPKARKSHRTPPRLPPVGREDPPGGLPGSLRGLVRSLRELSGFARKSFRAVSGQLQGRSERSGSSGISLTRLPDQEKKSPSRGPLKTPSVLKPLKTPYRLRKSTSSALDIRRAPKDAGNGSRRPGSFSQPPALWYPARVRSSAR